MAKNAPVNFRIAESAKAKISLILDEMIRFDPSEHWIAAVVWSTLEDAGRDVTGAGPGIAVYPAREITPDQTSSVNGLRIVFPGSDLSYFEEKTLSFDSVSDCFCLTSN